MKTPLHAVVFDLDGTLVDSLGDLHVASNALLAEHRRRRLETAEVRRYVGDGAPALIERAFAATGGWPAGLSPAVALERFLRHYRAGGHCQTRLYPGAMPMLEALRGLGLKLAICTNKPLAPTQALLATLGLSDRVDAVVGGDSYPQRKPAAQPVLGALEQLGALPGSAAMVGDSEVDVGAARAAGLASVVIMRHGYARSEHAALGADWLLDALAEIPGLLTGVFDVNRV
jgi:phosphoglycolate phosphatase